MFQNFFKNWRKPHQRKPVTRRSRLQVERLEDRAVPANNLSVNQFGTLLVIVDDDLSLAGTNDQRATLTYNAGQLTVNANGGTQLNNVAGPLSFFNIRDIVVEMGRGNDRINTNGVVLPGSLTFIGREGNDTLSMVGNNTLGGSIFFLGGDGDNTFGLNTGASQVSGVIDVVNGAGTQVVTVANDATSDEATVGAVFVRNGPHAAGTNNLLLGGAGKFTSFGPVVYTDDAASTGSAVAIIGNSNAVSSIGGDIFFAGTASDDILNVNNGHIRGSVICIANDGVDQLQMRSNNVIQGNVIFNGGAGDNFFRMDNGQQTVLGVVDIVNGDGKQEVHIADAQATDTATVGALFVNSGVNTSAAKNQLWIGNNVGARFASFGPVVFVESGASTAGADIKLETTGASYVGGDVFLGTAGGADETRMRNFVVTGSFIHLSGPENDELDYRGANVIHGNMFVDGGDGNNTMRLFDSLVVFGAMDIHNGAGRQVLVLGDGGERITVFGGLFVHNGPNTVPSNLVLIGSAGGTGQVRIAGPVFYVDFGTHTGGTAVFLRPGTTLGASLEVFTGDGNDGVFLDGDITIHGGVLVALGDGVDTFDSNGGPTILGPVTVLTGIGNDGVILTGTFRSDVFADVGAGNDLVHVGTDENPTVAITTSIQGAATFFLGDGVNTLRVNDTTFNSSVALFGGNGVDTVLIEKINSNAKTTFNGPVTGILGDGDDTLDVGLNNDADDGGVFNSFAFLDGGPGILDHLFAGSNIIGAGAARPGNSVANLALFTLLGFEDLTTP